MDSMNLRDDLMFSCLVPTLVTGDHPASPGLVSGVPWCPLPHGLAPPRTQGNSFFVSFLAAVSGQMAALSICK